MLLAAEVVENGCWFYCELFLFCTMVGQRMSIKMARTGSFTAAGGSKTCYMHNTLAMQNHGSFQKEKMSNVTQIRPTQGMH